MWASIAVLEWLFLYAKVYVYTVIILRKPIEIHTVNVACPTTLTIGEEESTDSFCLFTMLLRLKLWTWSVHMSF